MPCTIASVFCNAPGLYMWPYVYIFFQLQIRLNIERIWSTIHWKWIFWKWNWQAFDGPYIWHEFNLIVNMTKWAFLVIYICATKGRQYAQCTEQLWNKRSANVTSPTTMPAVTFCAPLYAHMLCFTQSRFMFKCWKWVLYYLPQLRKLLTKTCQLHGNLEIFKVANRYYGAWKICFQSVPTKMKKNYESKNFHHLKIYHDLKTLTRQA